MKRFLYKIGLNSLVSYKDGLLHIMVQVKFPLSPMIEKVGGKGLTATLTAKRLIGITPEVNLNNLSHTCD